MQLISYPKIRPLGHNEIPDFLEHKEHEVVITEKLDGANLRFIFYAGNIYFGTRNTIIDQAEEEESGWITTINYIKDKISLKNIEKYNNYTFFGEAMKKHTLSYNWETIPKFIGFEILDSDSNWLKHDEMEKIFLEIGLSVVPVIKRCKIGDLDEQKLQKPIPSLYRDGFAEGIVMKDQVTSERAKIVFDIPIEKPEKKSPIVDSSDDLSLVHKYADSKRISKIILNLMDEGKPLEMSIMKDLPKAVWNDIISEDYFEILTSNWKLDLKNIRKLISNVSKDILISKIEEEAQ